MVAPLSFLGQGTPPAKRTARAAEGGIPPAGRKSPPRRGLAEREVRLGTRRPIGRTYNRYNLRESLPIRRLFGGTPHLHASDPAGARCGRTVAPGRGQRNPHRSG